METTALIVIILGIFFGNFVQTVIGFAGALVAIPILLLVIGLTDAISYVTIFYAISSVYLTIKEWKDVDKNTVVSIIISSLIGIAIGTWILTFGDPQFLKRALGIFILIYVVYTYFDKNETRDMSKLKFFFGFLGGFSSSLFSIGGPMYVIIVRGVTSNMKIFRATMFGILSLVTVIRIPALAFTGLLDGTHLYYSLYIFPFFILSIYLGKKMFDVLNEIIFKKILLILLLLSGLVLTFK